MMKLRSLVSALSLGAVAACVGAAAGVSPLAASEDLRAVAEFDAILDPTERSRALFEEAARVITHPRCINCHPVTRTPSQGDDQHPHVPFFEASDSDIGPDGLTCTACHGPDNRTVLGSRIKSIPGNPHWSLAPQSMGWQGLTLREICDQLKDPDRNGDRSLDDLVHHAREDHLVAWAWHPGEGRTPAPGNQAAFSALVAAWIATGASCPR